MVCGFDRMKFWHIFNARVPLITGKAFNTARNADVGIAVDCLRYYAGWSDKISGNVIEVCPVVIAMEYWV